MKVLNVLKEELEKLIEGEPPKKEQDEFLAEAYDDAESSMEHLRMIPEEDMVIFRSPKEGFSPCDRYRRRCTPFEFVIRISLVSRHSAFTLSAERPSALALGCALILVSTPAPSNGQWSQIES